jgi:large subunit ribosomal protein L17
MIALLWIASVVLATALFERERIRTTLVKAKELRPYAERLITLAKRNDDRLHARRLVLRDIRDGEVVKKLFDSLGARFATRAGGYTRILRLGPRKGDGAEMAILELLGSEYKPKDKAEKAAPRTKVRPPAPARRPAEPPEEEKGRTLPRQAPPERTKTRRRAFGPPFVFLRVGSHRGRPIEAVRTGHRKIRSDYRA